MFIQSAFIRKNTKELRNKLEILGYINGAWESPHFDYPYLIVYPNKQYGIFKGDGFYITEDDIHFDGKIYPYKVPDNCIDCGTNEDLFFAIAALRDDTDKNQWFASNYFKSSFFIKDLVPDEWYLCTTDDYKDFFGDCPYIRNYDDYHKANVFELIEYFKEK